MGKIGKALKALWWVARRPVLLNRVLDDEDTWQSYVEKVYGMAGGLPVVPMDHFAGPGPVTLGPMTFLDGGSLPTDMMLLAGLAESIPDCRYFEIGTWRGESAATLSPRVKSCHTLCLTDEEMRSLGMHEVSIQAHGQFSRELENVTQLRGDSRTFDFTSLGQKFDLIFIDGDHHHDTIVSDTRNVFARLVHENSVVVWHDYGFHPDTVRYEVMAAILKGAGRDRSNRIYHVAHTKCAVFTGKEYPSEPAGFPMVPNEYYTYELKRNTNSSTERMPGSAP
jgi:predicted O-methyltransferase YrrM